MRVVFGGEKLVDDELCVQTEETHERVVFVGGGEQCLWRETGEFEERLVDYGFVFVLFVAADVAVCGEGFGEGEFEGVDSGSVPSCFDGHAAVIVYLAC